MMRVVLAFYLFLSSVWGFIHSAQPRLSRASSLQMNIFDRFTRVITSNINSVLKGLEDPEKVLDQAVNDMQNDLVKVRQSYAEISATLKRMQKQKDAADGLAADWYKRAELALQKGDEELAREALARRQVQLEISGNLEKQLNMQQNNIDKLYNSMTALDSKINEAKREKDAIIARARTAKTSVQVNDMLNSMTSVTSSNSMEAFNRMKEKVENLEAQAEIAGELAANSAGTSVSMEQRFKALEAGTAMDDELERMKRQLPSPSRSRSNNAPPSPPVSDIMRNLPPMEKAKLDDEYEKLRRELRGR